MAVTCYSDMESLRAILDRWGCLHIVNIEVAKSGASNNIYFVIPFLKNSATNKLIVCWLWLVCFSPHFPHFLCFPHEPHEPYFPHSPSVANLNRNGITARSGQFILKLYGDSTAISQLDYERSLLSYLNSQNLSFSVSKIIPTNSGETIVSVRKNDSILKAVLFSKIEGKNLDRKNILPTRSAGKALGELHLHLANFVSKTNCLPAWGDLDKIHPLVKDP